jgi:hypothetical protein
MSNAIYFDKESPDFNYGLNGRLERLPANRVILCIMTEYGLCNNKRMKAHQINSFIRIIQATSISKS